MDARTAIEAYSKEARFRYTVQAVVGAVMQDFGPVDPKRADADAHDIAVSVGALLYQRIYDEDSELNALKIERDHYKRLAEIVLTLTPQQTLFVKSAE